MQNVLMVYYASVIYKQQLHFKIQIKKYINCVKKVHHIYKNLVVGFAGDIKTALLMIEKIRNTTKLVG